VAMVLLASWADLWNAGAGGTSRSAAAASTLDCADGGRHGCVVRHDAELTGPGSPSWSFRLSLLAWAIPTAPWTKEPRTPGGSGCAPGDPLVREAPRRQQR